MLVAAEAFALGVAAGQRGPGFKMVIGEKDLPHGMPTPAASTVRQLMATALAEDYRGQDIVALHDMYRRWARKGGEK